MAPTPALLRPPSSADAGVHFDAEDDVLTEDAVWKSSYVNALPDSAFLYIAPGGTKIDGRTDSAHRHFPYKNDTGDIDIVHVRDAIGRIPQSNVPPDVKKRVQAKARDILAAHGGKPATANDTVTFDGSKMQRTPQGGLRGPAALTKVGVFKYRHRDGLRKGEIVSEYRPPEEVFAADSLATLEQAPITDYHPAEGNGFITPENFSRLSKGQVTGVKSELTHVVADAIIQDAATVARVLAGDRVELSCGYAYRQDWTPGVTADGQAYDMIQRNIRYNHVALLPRGGGRQGPDVALRFDSAILQEDAQMIINLDGKDYDLATEDGRKAYHQAMDAKIQAERTRADKGEADVAVLNAALAPLKAAQAKAVRDALETSARKVLGTDAKFDGMTDRQVRERALAARKITMDGKSDEIVNYAFDQLVETPVEGDPAMAAALASMHRSGPAPDTSQAPVLAAWANKWKEPLTASKDRK